MADVAESPQRRSREFCSLLREVTIVAEEWETRVTRTEDLLAEVDKSRNKNDKLKNENDKLRNENDKLRNEIDKLRNRNASLKVENGLLYDKNEAKEREALILRDRDQDREKFLHEIHVRKKTKTLLIQERKECLQIISNLKERVKLLEGDKILALNRTSSRRKTKAVLLLLRKRLLNKIEVQKRTEKVLLQERSEIIDCLSNRIRAKKKRESQLLLECKKGEVKLRKALDKLRHHRDTVSDRTITILWDVTKKVLALTMDVEDSQPIGDKTRTPRSKLHMKIPSTLPCSWKQAKRIISRAEDAFCEAVKNWVRDRDFMEAVKISCREGLIEKILGRKERPSEAEAALRDILDESQTMERQPQTKHNILAALELKDSEKKKARRKQNNPRRLETSPSPSPQETEVCRKRKRIGSEELKAPRSRRKPQRYGTSPPPPSKRMKVPRERKRPQRYRTSP